MKNTLLKPNKTAFVYFSFLKSFLIAIIVSAIIFFVTNISSIFEQSYIIFLIIGIILIFNFINLNIAYKKTNYEFFEDKIIANTGSIFTNSSVELVVKNITHVTMVKPFIANKVFGVGVILIELAGSAGAEGLLYYIDSPEKTYSLIKNVMKENGFKLNQNKLIQKEKPAIIGVLIETIGSIIFGFIVLFWFIMPSLFTLISLVPNFILPIVGLIVFILVFSGIFFNFMNLLSRTYYIYEDTIVYYEGFLTKVDSFMPVENLADSQVTQSLLEKIFDLHDIKISCQGASHEILFKNLRNGEQMERNIDYLVKNMKPLAKTKIDKKEKSKDVIALKVAAPKKEKLNFDTKFIYETKMHLLRSLFYLPLIVIAIFLFFVISDANWNMWAIIAGFFMAVFVGFLSAIGIFIQVYFTKFKILEKGVSENFDFLNKKNIEFSVDKITGVIFKKNFIDNFFNTFTVTFWSIGSGTNINFKNINESLGLKEKILAKLAMNNEKEIYRINSKVSVIELIKANIILSILISWTILVGIVLSLINIIFIVLPVFLIVISIITIFYKKWFYSTSKLIFTKNYLYFKAGIFFINEYYALYDNAKDITTTKYPFSKYGAIMFNIAGETTVQSSNNFSNVDSKYGVPHAFTISYCEKIDVKDDLIDMILHNRPTEKEIAEFVLKLDTYDPKTILLAKPSLKNSLLVMGLIFGFISTIIGIVLYFIASELVIIAILTFIIGIIWTIWSTKVITYKIQPYRVLAKYGIFYKKQTSIVFNKIDHLKNFQGITNKLFSNGSIIVFTTGSGRPELIISNISEFKEFYKKLEEFYH